MAGTRRRSSRISGDVQSQSPALPLSSEQQQQQQQQHKQKQKQREGSEIVVRAKNSNTTNNIASDEAPLAKGTVSGSIRHKHNKKNANVDDDEKNSDSGDEMSLFEDDMEPSSPVSSGLSSPPRSDDEMMDMDEDSKTSPTQTQGFCRYCYTTEVGDFYNSWYRVTKNYFLPSLAGSYNSLLVLEKEQSTASGESAVKGW